MRLMLKEMRESRGITQKELANKIGSTLRKISSWETDEVRIPLLDAARIADVFHCSLDELAGRDFSSSDTYADPRQAELNECWQEADEAQRSIILGVAQMGVGRAGADAPGEAPAVEADRRQAG